MRYVALLRGINVGPTTKVAMADLREAFAAYTDVTTILQSGNVVFTATTVDVPALSASIASATGFPAQLIVLSQVDFTAIAAANPLDGDNPSLLVTTFLDGPPPAGPELPDLGDERVVITDRAIYQWCPHGVSKSRLSPTWWRRLGPLATSRNQRTVERILAVL